MIWGVLIGVVLLLWYLFAGCVLRSRWFNGRFADDIFYPLPADVGTDAIFYRAFVWLISPVVFPVLAFGCCLLGMAQIANWFLKPQQ